MFKMTVLFFFKKVVTFHEDYTMLCPLSSPVKVFDLANCAEGSKTVLMPISKLRPPGYYDHIFTDSFTSFTVNFTLILRTPPLLRPVFFKQSSLKSFQSSFHLHQTPNRLYWSKQSFRGLYAAFCMSDLPLTPLVMEITAYHIETILSLSEV